MTHGTEHRGDGPIEWRPIAWAPEYEISEYGDLRQVRRTGPWSQIGPRKGALDVKPTQTYIDHRIRNKRYRCHRLVCEAWHGPCPFEGAVVAHNDGNSANNHYSNLRWATQKENLADARRHGTFPVGEKQGSAILSDRQAREIHARVANGEKRYVLAAEYGVQRESIGRIARGQAYRHLGLGAIKYTPARSPNCKRGHVRTPTNTTKRGGCKICAEMMRAKRARDGGGR